MADTEQPAAAAAADTGAAESGEAELAPDTTGAPPAEMDLTDMIYPPYDQAFEGGGMAMQMFNFQGFYMNAPFTFQVAKGSVAGRPIMLRTQGSASLKDGFNAMLISQAPHPYGNIEAMLNPASLFSSEPAPALMTALALRKDFPENNPQACVEGKFQSAGGPSLPGYVVPITGAEFKLQRMISGYPLTLTAAASMMQGALTASAVSGTGPVMYGANFMSRFDGTNILGFGASLAGMITATYTHHWPPAQQQAEMEGVAPQGSFKFSWYNPLGETGAVLAAEVGGPYSVTSTESIPRILCHRWRSPQACCQI